MSITIRGVRLDSLSVSHDGDKEKVTGQYSLMSNQDKALAKQGFNGYSEVKVDFSHNTMKALNALQKGVKEDIEIVLGLIEQKGQGND